MTDFDVRQNELRFTARELPGGHKTAIQFMAEPIHAACGGYKFQSSIAKT